jgi:hypothetical protein
MENMEQRPGAELARRREKGAGALWKVGALLVLVFLMADVLTRQIGLLGESSRAPMPGKATTNFFKVQVGDFRAEIQWNSISSQE